MSAVPLVRLTVMGSSGAAVVVHTAVDGVFGAGVRTGALLTVGTPVTLVVDGGGCSVKTVAMLAGLRLESRRTGVRLIITLEDEDLRMLVQWAGLAEVLEG